MIYVIEWPEGKNNFDTFLNYYAEELSEVFECLWDLTLNWCDGDESKARECFVTSCREGSFGDIAQVYIQTEEDDGTIIRKPFIIYK